MYVLFRINISDIKLNTVTDEKLDIFPHIYALLVRLGLLGGWVKHLTRATLAGYVVSPVIHMLVYMLQYIKE